MVCLLICFFISSRCLLWIMIVVMVMWGVQWGIGMVVILVVVFFGEFFFYCIGGVDCCVDGVV